MGNIFIKSINVKFTVFTERYYSLVEFSLLTSKMLPGSTPGWTFINYLRKHVQFWYDSFMMIHNMTVIILKGFKRRKNNIENHHI